MFNFRLKVISDGLLSRGRQTRVQIETAPYSVDVCTLDSQTHSADADLELELELENVKFKKKLVIREKSWMGLLFISSPIITLLVIQFHFERRYRIAYNLSLIHI